MGHSNPLDTCNLQFFIFYILFWPTDPVLWVHGDGKHKKKYGHPYEEPNDNTEISLGLLVNSKFKMADIEITLYQQKSH